MPLTPKKQTPGFSAALPTTKKAMAAAICAAMWRGSLNAYLDDRAFKAEFERAADVVQGWIDQARAA